MPNGHSPTSPPASRDWEKITLFVFGTFFFIVLLAIAWADRHPSSSSWFIYICVLAMAAGGVAALLPGTLNVVLHPGIRAGGALAIAVLVFYFGQSRPTSDTIIQGLKLHLDGPQGSLVDPSSDVYVTINSKLAAYSKGLSGSRDLDFGANDWKGAKQVDVARGAGGIQIDYGTLAPGDKVVVFSKGPSGSWWISNDMIVPEGELAMRNSSIADVKARVENGQ